MRTVVLSMTMIAAAIFFEGCCEPEVVVKEVYVERPCPKLNGFAGVKACQKRVYFLSRQIDEYNQVFTKEEKR